MEGNVVGGETAGEDRDDREGDGEVSEAAHPAGEFLCVAETVQEPLIVRHDGLGDRVGSACRNHAFHVTSAPPGGPADSTALEPAGHNPKAAPLPERRAGSQVPTPRVVSRGVDAPGEP